MNQQAFPNVDPTTLIGVHKWLLDHATRDEIADALVQIDFWINNGKDEREAIQTVFSDFVPVWVSRFGYLNTNRRGLRYHLSTSARFSSDGALSRFRSLCGQGIWPGIFKGLTVWDRSRVPIGLDPAYCRKCVISARALRRKGKLKHLNVDLDKMIGREGNVLCCRVCGWVGRESEAKGPPAPTPGGIAKMIPRYGWCPKAKCGAAAVLVWKA